MKKISFLLSFLFPILIYCQNENPLKALDFVEQIAEKSKIQEEAVKNFRVTADVKTTNQMLDFDFKVVKHALLDQKELGKLNTEIKNMLNQASNKPHLEQEKYTYKIENNKFKSESYFQQDIAGVNYQKELAKMFKSSLEGELFNKYFLGIRNYKEYDLKHGIWTKMDRLEFGYFLDDYVGDYTSLNFWISARLPEYLRKTKRYTYQYEEASSLIEGLVKISFKETKRKENFKQGYFIIDRKTRNLVEVYIEKSNDEIVGCSISSTHVFYEKQNEEVYLPTKITLNSCEKCYYYKIKHKLKRVKPEPNKSLKFKAEGNYNRIREIDISIDYELSEKI